MTREGKLMQFSPLIKNNTHQIWDGPKGRYYKFVIGFDNGDIGTAMSTFTTPKWEIGQVYIYELKETIYNNQKQYSISGMNKKMDTQQNGNVKTKDWTSHAMQTAIAVTSELYKQNIHLNLEYKNKELLITYFFNWITNVVNGNNDLYWRAFSVLNSAVNFAISKDSTITNTSEIALLANSLFVMCDVQKEQQPTQVPMDTTQATNNNPQYPVDTDALPF